MPMILIDTISRGVVTNFDWKVEGSFTCKPATLGFSDFSRFISKMCEDIVGKGVGKLLNELHFLGLRGRALF